MIDKKRSSLLLISFFILVVLVSVVAVLMGEVVFLYTSVPLIFILLMVIYINYVKKVNIYFLAYLFLILISETLFLYKREYFNYVLTSSIISQIILIAFIVSFKHIKYKNAILYFFITAVSYFVIYRYVVDVEVVLMLLIYVLVNSILVAFTMVNYLRKMYLANYLLFLGVAFGVLNNAIMSLDIDGVNSSIPALITNIITHTSICLSFIARVNRPAKEFR